MKRKHCLKELTIKDNFMFGAVMMDENNCKGFLERVLEMPIDRVEVSREKSIVYHPEYKGVRLDVYAKDEHRKHYNVEMQVRKKAALGKRSRYYQSQMDMEILLSGEDYAEIPDTYVIFLCDFDPFDEEKYRYTFEMRCKESEKTNLKDGRVILFLNTHGKNEGEVPKELVTFLKYVKADLAGSEEEFDDPYVDQLQKFIRKIKESREMEERFMVFEEMLKEERAEGKLEGYIDILTNLLQEIGEIPTALQEKIASEKEEEVLIAWAKLAAKVTSIEEFMQKM